MKAKIIAVAGGSGSGKTTFAKMLCDKIGVQHCGVISQDWYYYDQKGRFDYDGGAVNFDHPDSLEFSLLKKHLLEIKNGRDVLVPQYCFKTHSRLKQCQLFNWKPIVIVDGILILNSPELRSCFDDTVFISTSEALRFTRRLNRDVRERGRTPNGVKEQFQAQVKPMHDTFVEPSQMYAKHNISGESPFNSAIEKFSQLACDFLETI